MLKLQISGVWAEKLMDQFEKSYMLKLNSFPNEEKVNGKIIYPPYGTIFNAFKLCQFDQVKVIIVGQDPYHRSNQANGLSFSVKKNIPIPPSLSNIYKELSSDLNIPKANHGCLEKWSQQGVLLLNSCLTVEHGKPGSHQNKGWEIFTDSVLTKLNTEKRNLVFILWGRQACRKCQFLNKSNHFVIESPHPSPFSANRGFFGSKPFSKTNFYLTKHNIKEIDWTA